MINKTHFFTLTCICELVVISLHFLETVSMLIIELKLISSFLVHNKIFPLTLSAILFKEYLQNLEILTGFLVCLSFAQYWSRQLKDSSFGNEAQSNNKLKKTIHDVRFLNSIVRRH